ncbi:MAG TPA: hypothetical protein VMT64_17480, partial [Candidatus Binataceae bacterium]|nr:hypothetical protein [Candidatus Binataceae bacterium]
MLRTRVLTAAVALPTLLVAIFFLPDAAFSWMIALLGLWGLYETWEMAHPLSLASIIMLMLFGLMPLFWLLAGPMEGFYPPPYPEAHRALIIMLAV